MPPRACGGGEKGDRDQTPCETDRNRIASKRVVYIESVPTSTLLDSSHRRDRREKPFMREHEDGCGRLRPLDTGGGSGKWRWPRCILAQTGPRRAGVEGSQQPSSVRPSLRPPGKQLTAAAATAGPHSRAPLSAMSFILHQLISFQTYNSEGRRRRGGASVAAPSLTRRHEVRRSSGPTPKTRSPR